MKKPVKSQWLKIQIAEDHSIVWLIVGWLWLIEFHIAEAQLYLEKNQFELQTPLNNGFCDGLG